MLVKDYMTRHPIMIEPHKPIMVAQQIMNENKIRHLPVVADGKRLLGLVTRQRLRIPPDRLGSLNMWEITRYLSGLTVEKVMVKGQDLKTITPDSTLEEAADIMTRHKIGSLPVIEDGMVLGIITETDLLIELQNLLGANEPGWRVTMHVPDRQGEFSKTTAAIAKHGWGLMSMGSVRTPKDENTWELVLKVRRCTKEELMAALSAIEGQKVVDIRETRVYTS